MFWYESVSEGESETTEQTPLSSSELRSQKSIKQKSKHKHTTSTKKIKNQILGYINRCQVIYFSLSKKKKKKSVVND